MAKQFLWKIGGEAGFGIMTTGLLFSKIASRHGYHVFDYNEYPSLIRGGHNTYEVLISDEGVYGPKQPIDLLVCLNQETYTTHRHRLTAQSLVVYDEEDFKIEENSFVKINVPMKKILNEKHGILLMLNNVALGASLALMNWEFEILSQIIEKNFSRKGPEVIEQNRVVAEEGFNYIKNHYNQLIIPLFPERTNAMQLVITGNDAFCLGALLADCRLYSAYPMTPSSSLLATLASYAAKTGMVVRHAEDEISVINTALGASWAGVRAAVGTSGGGFALMTETLSFAGVAEIPLVIYLGQRPGPATGMPTWTEQGDLLFAVHAGHGEFPKIVLAPGDVEEMYQLTMTAFDLADIYQTPVILIADRFLCESHQSTSLPTFQLFSQSYRPNRGKITDTVTSSPYRRYQLTEDGVSPLLIPGQPNHFYQTNSYEHEEDGHTTEAADSRQKQVDKRNKKRATYLKTHFQPPKVFGNMETANIIFVSWGGNKGPIREAMKLLKEKNLETAYIHFTHLYPLDEAKVKTFFPSGKRYVAIENNSQAQLAQLLRLETGLTITKKLLKYDGRPFYPEEIVQHVLSFDH